MARFKKFLEKWFMYKGALSVLLAVLSVTMLPRALKALFMSAVQNELPVFVTGLCDAAVFVAAAVFLFLASFSFEERRGYVDLREKETSADLKGNMRNPTITFALCGISLVWILLFETVRNFLYDKQAVALVFELSHTNFFVRFLPRALSSLAVSLGAAFFLSLFIVATGQSACKGAGDPAPAVIKQVFRTLLGGIPRILLLFAAIFASRVIFRFGLAGIIALGAKDVSVISYLTRVLLLSFPVVLLMLPAFSCVKGLCERAFGEAKTEETSKTGFKATPVLLAAGILPSVAVLIILIIGNISRVKPSDYAVDGTFLYADSAAHREYLEDYVGAVRDLDKMDAVAESYLAYIDGRGQRLDELLDQMPDVEQIFVLKLYNDAREEGDIEEIRSALMDRLNDDPDSLYWYHIYLELVPRSGGDEARKYIIERLITSEKYRIDVKTPFDFKKKDEDRIREGLDDEALAKVREKFIPAKLKVLILDSRSKYDKDYDLAVDEAFKTAEKYSDNPDVQLFAIQIGTEAYGEYRLNVRGRGLLESTGKGVCEAALRYDKIKTKEIEENKDLTEEEKKESLEDVKLYVANCMFDLRRIDDAENYLAEAVKTVDSRLLKDMLITAALTNIHPEKAKPLIEEALAADPGSYIYRMEAALCYYRTREIEKSLENAVKLAEIAGEKGADPKAGAALMSIVDTYVNGDHSLPATGTVDDTITGDADVNYADKRSYKLYRHLTDEQKEIVEGSRLLSALLDYEDYYSNTWPRREEDRKEFREKTEGLEGLVAQYPDLSAGYYILAKLYGLYSAEHVDGIGDLLDYNKAENNYLKCLAIDPDQPIVWYTLSGLYEHIGEYRNCYLSAKKAVDLAIYGPYGIHMGDAYYGYGLVPHAIFVMEQFSSYADDAEQ